MKIFYKIFFNNLFLFIFAIVLPVPIFSQTVDTVFSEKWESGIGSWYADNGVWDVGVPTVGPSITYSGQNCAATILDGNYPPNAHTRLISPQIILPNISSDEKLQLKFWHWFRTESSYVGILCR